MNDSDSLRVRQDRRLSIEGNENSGPPSRTNSRPTIPLTPFQGSSLNERNVNLKNIDKIAIVRNNINIYSCSEEIYRIIKINHIMYDEKKALVSKFKDQLIWYETSDYLKR